MSIPISSSRLCSMLVACALGAAALACNAEPSRTGPRDADPGTAEQCSSDADCTLYCQSGCCLSSCPCSSAITTTEASRRQQEVEDRCSDVKMECPVEGRDACDWEARFRATCSNGTCVAEAIEGGATLELRPQPTPQSYDVEDEECRLCREWNDRSTADATTCSHLVEWLCTTDRACRMTIPCSPSCCQTRSTREIGLGGAAPWAPHMDTSSKPVPPPGLLVATARGRGETATGARLIFATPAPASMVETDVVLGWPASVAWIHGTRDVVLGGSSLERMSFPSRERVRLAEGIHTVRGLDVTPAGDRLVFAGPATAGDPRLGVPDGSLEVLVLRTQERSPLSLAAGDSHPRWSTHGAQIVFQGRGQPGRLGMVDPTSGKLDETRASEAFLRPVWHPSGGFLLAWLEDADRCRLVLVTHDRQRFAPTTLQHAVRPGYQRTVDACGDLAVSPSGTHVAFWRRAGEDDELVMAVLAWPGAQVVLGTVGIGGAIDWTEGVRMDELGVSGGPVEGSAGG